MKFNNLWKILGGRNKRAKEPVEAQEQQPVEEQEQQQQLVEEQQQQQPVEAQCAIDIYHRLIEEQQQQQQQQQPVEAQKEARTIFLVGTYHPANPKFAAVVQYDLNKLTTDEIPEFECVARFKPFNPKVEHNHGVKLSEQYDPNYKMRKDKTPKSKSVARLNPGVKWSEHDNRIVWKACVHSSISTSTSTILCLLPVYLYKEKNASDDSGIEEDVPLTAYMYDMRTATILEKFKAPEASKFSGLVFCLEDMIYCIAYPSWTNIKPSPSFQRYDLKNKETSNLESFPWDDISVEKILGHAVFQDFVLFNVYPRGLWAYFVKANEWYEVLSNNQPPSFQGVGVVVEENTLYALKESRDDSILLRLLVEMKKETDDAVEFTASLDQEFILPDRYYSRYKARDWDKDVLVHLGEHEFCLVRNGLLGKGHDLQLLQLVMFTAENKKVIVSDILEHQVEICEYSPFEPILGFSLPAYHSKQFKDKQKDGLGTQITLDPMQLKRSSRTPKFF